jgi:hypothetical protein
MGSVSYYSLEIGGLELMCVQLKMISSMCILFTVSLFLLLSVPLNNNLLRLLSYSIMSSSLRLFFVKDLLKGYVIFTSFVLWHESIEGL